MRERKEGTGKKRPPAAGVSRSSFSFAISPESRTESFVLFNGSRSLSIAPGAERGKSKKRPCFFFFLVEVEVEKKLPSLSHFVLFHFFENAVFSRDSPRSSVPFGLPISMPQMRPSKRLTRSLQLSRARLC